MRFDLEYCESVKSVRIPRQIVIPVESLKVGADVAEDGLDDGLGGGVAQSGLQSNQFHQVAGVTTDLGRERIKASLLPSSGAFSGFLEKQSQIPL